MNPDRIDSPSPLPLICLDMEGMMGGGDAEEVDASGEAEKLKRERNALFAKSNFTKNTQTNGAMGATTQANVFKSTLGG